METLTVERREGGVAVVRLARADKRSAMSPACFRGLIAVMARSSTNRLVEQGT